MLILKPCEQSEYPTDDALNESQLALGDECRTNDVPSECPLAWNGDFQFRDGCGGVRAGAQCCEDGGC